MNYYVYVLESLNNGRYYVGVTKDPGQRLEQHNSGSVASTKPFRPWRLLGVDRFPDLAAARGVEKRLKESRSRKSIERFVERARLVPTSDPFGRSRDPDSFASGEGDRDC